MATNFRALRLAATGFGLVALTALAGCGADNRSVVSGTVLVDGQPLGDGTIQFYPVEGHGQTAGAGVKDGKYRIEAGVGPMKVVLNGAKVVGKIKQYNIPNSPVVDDVRELLPARYNTKSELTATLKAGENENVDFDLKSK